MCNVALVQLRVRWCLRTLRGLDFSSVNSETSVRQITPFGTLMQSLTGTGTGTGP